MKLIGICPVRNESWVLGLSLRAALQWCDSVVVLLHACTDDSAAIVAEISRENYGRVIVLEDSGDTWDEMQHRQLLLESARQNGATHIAIVDADEILTGNLTGAIQSVIERLQTGHILQVPLYNLRGGIERYHASGIWANRTVSLAFKDDGRANWQGDGFHHREPFGFANKPFRPFVHNQGGVLHLWGASEKRLHEKHRAYRVTERLRWPSKPSRQIEELYGWAERGTGRHGDTPETWRFSPVAAEWWAAYSHLMHHLKLYEEPWQLPWVESMIAEHGRERFAGLSV